MTMYDDLKESPEGIADEVVRLLATKVAERVTEAAQGVSAGVPHGTASIDSKVIVEALRDGRVARLLVHDAMLDGPLAALMRW